MEKRRLATRLGILGTLIASLGFISAAPWSIQNTLNQWAEQGVFMYLLPFLLVFALVFAIIQKSKILGDNKVAAAIIAVALGLLSLVGDYFPKFLEKFTPNLSIGISVLLAIIILLGLFYDHDKKKGVTWIIYVFIGVGILAFFFILADTFGPGNVYARNIWEEYGPAIITLIIVVAIIIVIGKFSGNSSTEKKDDK